jgi:hypothetical protein
MNYKQVRPNGAGIFRVHNFSTPVCATCVWIGEVFGPNNEVIKAPRLGADTIINLRSAGGRHTAEAYAEDLNFS